MKTVKITEILEYYDGIQIFAARDPIGGHYIGDMIDTVGDFDRYAVVGVSPERLADFRAGQVDLRTVLLEMPGGEWYMMMPEGGIDEPQALIPQPESLAESGYLPQDGYFLEPEEPRDYEAVRRALERGKTATLTGSVEQVNRSTGEWGLLTSHGVKKRQDLSRRRRAGRPANRQALLFPVCRSHRTGPPSGGDRQVLYLQSIETA